MFNSDYQVQTLSGGQLQVIASRDLLFALWFLGMGAVPVIFFLYRLIKSRSLYPLLGMLFGVPLIVGGYFSLRTGTLTLDRAADTAAFHQPRIFGRDDLIVPLHTLRFATIRTMRASSYIAVVLDSGDALTFADSTDQGGKGRAVVAINRYLGAGDH